MDKEIQIPFQVESKKDGIKNLPSKIEELKQTDEVVESDNKDFIYTYVLSTPTQKEQIDLTKYKKQFQDIFKTYFGTKLISLSIKKDRYTLTLNEEYKRGEKLRIGRLISDKTDLKKYAKRVAYNGGQDKSGQIFIIKKGDSSNVTDNK